MRRAACMRRTTARGRAVLIPRAEAYRFRAIFRPGFSVRSASAAFFDPESQVVALLHAPPRPESEFAALRCYILYKILPRKRCFASSRVNPHPARPYIRPRSTDFSNILSLAPERSPVHGPSVLEPRHLRRLRRLSLHRSRDLRRPQGRLRGLQGPAPRVRQSQLCDEIEKQNEAVDAALGGLTVPLSTLHEARTKRDAAIPDWAKQIRRLEDAAKATYRDEVGRFDALFAEPAAALTHTRPKHRKVKVTAATLGDATAAAAKKKPAKRRKRLPG